MIPAYSVVLRDDVRLPGAVPFDPTELRHKVERLEHELRKLPQLEIEPEHHFAPHLYVRTLRLPAGTILTGKVHATEHIFILSEGELTVITDDGVKRLKAPYQAVCRAGMKRAGVCHTDVVCSNVHITDQTELHKLEAELIVPEALEAPAVQEILQ